MTLALFADAAFAAAVPAEKTISLTIADYAGNGYYRYCPTVFVDGEGVRHAFYCHNRDKNVTVDYIYHATVDAAGNLSNEVVALSPCDTTGTGWDSYHVCDPSVIDGAFFYNGHTYKYLMAYLGVKGKTDDNSSDGAKCINNKVGFAVSDNLDSGWVRMGTDAVVVTGTPANWGVGQPSIVSLDGKGKVGLFYCGDYGTRFKALDFTDATKTESSLVQFTGDKGTFVSCANISDLKGLKTTGMTITNGDFAYDPRTKFLYLITDTPDAHDGWYDDGGAGIYVVKAVTVYRAPMDEVTATNLKNAQWELVKRIQSADLNTETFATGYRCHNSGFVRRTGGTLTLKDAFVTVTKVFKGDWTKTFHSYHFVPVTFGSTPPVAEVTDGAAVAGIDWIGSSVSAAFVVGDWGSAALDALSAELAYSEGGEDKSVSGVLDATTGRLTFDVAGLAAGQSVPADIKLWANDPDAGKVLLSSCSVEMLQGLWGWRLTDGWAWFEEAPTAFTPACWSEPDCLKRKQDGALEFDTNDDLLTFSPAKGSGAGRQAVLEISLVFPAALTVDDVTISDDVQGGLRLVEKSEGVYGFQVYVADDSGSGWRDAAVDGLSPEIGVRYDFRIETDYAASEMVYKVRVGDGWYELCRGNRTAASATEMRGIELSGQGTLCKLRGNCETQFVDASLAKSADGTSFASVGAAVSAGATQPLELLWDASWKPTAPGTLTVSAPNRLHIDLSSLEAGSTAEWNGNTVTVGPAMTPEERKQAEIIAALPAGEGHDAAVAKVSALFDGSNAQDVADWLATLKPAAGQTLSQAIAAAPAFGMSYAFGTALFVGTPEAVVTDFAPTGTDGTAFTLGFRFQDVIGGTPASVAVTRAAQAQVKALVKAARDLGWNDPLDPDVLDVTVKDGVVRLTVSLPKGEPKAFLQLRGSND